MVTSMTEGCGGAGWLEWVPDAHVDATTHSISVMEAGGVTLVSEVPKVTHQVSAWWGWLPRAMWSAHIARWRIEEALPFTFIIWMSAWHSQKSLGWGSAPNCATSGPWMSRWTTWVCVFLQYNNKPKSLALTEELFSPVGFSALWKWL